MPDPRIVQLNGMTIAELALLTPKDYTNAMRLSLRDEVRWARFMDPTLIERTRHSLGRLISSIDAQRLSVRLETDSDRDWLRAVNALQGWARDRLVTFPPLPMLPESNNKEIRAWKALSATLADELGSIAPEALDRLRTPYGNLTLRQWLAIVHEREEHNASAH